MNKEQIKELKIALQKLMVEMDELRATAAELREEEEMVILPTPPRFPSPGFLPMRTLSRSASAPGIVAPKPELAESGWVSILVNSPSVSPGR